MAKTATAKPQVEAKMRPTGSPADEHIELVEPPARRDDARALDRMMRRVTGKEPAMWGASIIGYGKLHYKYETGREGDMPEAGFAARKGNFVIYVDDFAERPAMLARLGKHKTGKACLYINKLADVDLKVLENITTASVKHARKKYPQN